jgi:hypothetical protein
MSINDSQPDQDKIADYKLRDADDTNGVVPEDALQNANPAAAAELVPDQDPHHVAKDHSQYNTDVTKD